MTRQTLKNKATEAKARGLDLTADNFYWFNAIVKEIEREEGHTLSDSEKGYLLFDLQLKG